MQKSKNELEKPLLNFSVLPLSKSGEARYLQQFVCENGPITINEFTFKCKETAIGSWHYPISVSCRVIRKSSPDEALKVFPISTYYGKKMPLTVLTSALDANGEVYEFSSSSAAYNISADIQKFYFMAFEILESKAKEERKKKIDDIKYRYHYDEEYRKAFIEERNTVALLKQTEEITQYCSKLMSIKDNIEAVIRDLTGQDKNAIIEGIMDPKKMKSLGIAMKDSIFLNDILQRDLSSTINNYNKIITSKKPKVRCE